MLSLRGIVIYCVFGVISKYMVEGLQCYVCDDCNEYEDFKELHICGEIAAVTTMKPVALPEVVENPKNGTTITATAATTVKPVHEDTEEYIYDDSVETHGEENSSQNNSVLINKRTKTVIKTTTKPTTTTAKITVTAVSTSGKPLQVNGDDDYLEYDLTNAGEDSKTENPTTLTNKPTVQQHETTTHSSSTSSAAIDTKPSASSNPSQLTGDEDYLEYDLINSDGSPAIVNKPQTVKVEETTTKSTSVASSLSSSTDGPTASSSVPSLPIELTAEYDYLDYDIEQRSIQKNSKASHTSLLKMNEPVCYMIKFSVNNTVITNRGCTNFINANSYLTCQSLYNGAPMNACRVCSSDGCNKFLSSDDSDEDHDIIFDAAGVPDKFSIFVVLLFTIICSVVV